MSMSGEKAKGSGGGGEDGEGDFFLKKPATNKRPLKTKLAPPPPKIRRDLEDENSVEIKPDLNIDNVLGNGIGIEEPDESLLLDDSDGGDMEPQVSQLINQLHSQIHHRVRAKKQMLDHNFQAVLSIPSRLSTLQSEQRACRERMISEFKDAVGNMNERLNEVIQLQQRNEEKQGKMVIALTRENDSMKKLLTGLDVTGLVHKFTAADKNLSKQMETEAVQDAEQNTKSVQVLQRKLLLDGQKEGSEALINLHRLI